VVHGNLLAAEAPAAVGRTINVACGKSYNLLELVAGINDVLGTHIKPVFEPARAGDVRESLADISLAKKLLNYEPTVGFEEGLRQTVDYYRSSTK
jgi:UDP-glucose 4-epimerase